MRPAAVGGRGVAVAKQQWPFRLAVVAAILALIAFVLSYANDDPKYVTLIMAILMVILAWSSRPK